MTTNSGMGNEEVLDLKDLFDRTGFSLPFGSWLSTYHEFRRALGRALAIIDSKDAKIQELRDKIRILEWYNHEPEEQLKREKEALEKELSDLKETNKLLAQQGDKDFHEARYERFKVSHGFQISIKRLKDFSNWYAEYNLTSRGWKWCEYGEVHEIGKILFTHGWFTGGSHARRHLQLFHKNVIYGHCFSSDTEIMTRSGWKLFSDTSVGEEVATINPITLNSEWNKINQKFEYGNYDKLIEFKKRSHNFCVTEDHSIIRKYDERGKWEKVKAKSLFDKNFIIPTASKNNNPEYPITDDELRIMAWIITEGNIEKIGNCRLVRIAQSDKPKVSHNRIIDICNRLGLKNSCKKRYSAGETNHGQHRNFDAYRIYINRCDLLDKIIDMIPRS